tara:strand:- start:5399 stop:6094 length:696 start_codon:yes stop_codon:yes gene_type:complete
MKQWHPVPAEFAAALVKTRWTKENQAPEAVAYLWCWNLTHSGVNVSIRDLANYTGWSRWRARIMREKVVAIYNGWIEGEDFGDPAQEDGRGKPHETSQQPDSGQTRNGQQPATKPKRKQRLSRLKRTAARQQTDSNQTDAGRSRVNSSYKYKNKYTSFKKKNGSGFDRIKPEVSTKKTNGHDPWKKPRMDIEWDEAVKQAEEMLVEIRDQFTDQKYEEAVQIAARQIIGGT